MADAGSLLSWLLSHSEERFGLAIADLLSSERFIKGLEQAMGSGAAVRSQVEKAMARLLQVFNVPTLKDLAELEAKLEELEELLGEVSEEVQRIEAAMRRPRQGAASKTRAARNADAGDTVDPGGEAAR